MFLSKLYRQMYAGTGISTDSARRKKSKAWAKWTARQCKKLFRAKPMPELASRTWETGFVTSISQAAFTSADGAES
jgi:Fe-S cluster assembly scaffold protein SufB